MTYYEADGVTLHLGDCRAVMAQMEPESVDAIVTDPPAGISFMGKSWDHDKGGRDSWIEWMAQVAAECLRVVKPGAHAFVWALPRTSHWTATAWENGGWECRDCVYHIFGTGFPKSADVSKAIDKAAGVEREVVGANPTWREAKRTQQIMEPVRGGSAEVLTAPATDAARQWQGWGTALKPAVECWWLCRKPLSERTVAANVQKHGTGGINIDATRIGTDDDTGRRGPGGYGMQFMDVNWQPPDIVVSAGHPSGRWPANLVLSCTCEETREGPTRKTPRTIHARASIAYGGSKVPFETQAYGDAVRIHTDPNCPCAMLDAQSGERKAGAFPAVQQQHRASSSSVASGKIAPAREMGDSGGASRFFYCAKAGRNERNGSNHPTVKPVVLMSWLCRLITPPNGLILDPFVGSGTTAVAARMGGFRCVGIDNNEEYLSHAAERLRLGDEGLAQAVKARRAGAEQPPLEGM